MSASIQFTEGPPMSIELFIDGHHASEQTMKVGDLKAHQRAATIIFLQICDAARVAEAKAEEDRNGRHH